MDVRDIKEKYNDIGDVIDAGKIAIDSWDKTKAVYDYGDFDGEPAEKTDLFLTFCLQGLIKDGLRKIAVIIVAAIANEVVLSSNLHWMFKCFALPVFVPLCAKYLTAKLENEIVG